MLTTQGMKEVEALARIKERLRAEGIYTPLVADVHFSSDVALAVAGIADKVRINPGNFARVHEEACDRFRQLIAICREKGVLFHTDAVQAVAHIPVNVREDNIDLLSSSAHKFHGPKGVGFLFAKKGVRLSNLIEGGAQEGGKRAGTENVPGIASMTTALKEANAKMAEDAAHLTAMRDRIIRGLSEIPHSALNGDATHRLPGNVNFCFEGIEGESLLLLLDDKGICASSGSACTSGSLDPSHVLLAIGRVHDVAHGSLRLSIGEEITQEEADYIVQAVKDVVTYLRSFSPIWRDLMEGKKEFIL